jgi:predicted dehydrogenase
MFTQPLKEKIRFVLVVSSEIPITLLMKSFKKAKKNSELTALIGNNQEELEIMATKYKIKNFGGEEMLEELFKGQKVDAVYLASGVSSHKRLTELAAHYGIHILCPRPMAMTTEDSLHMKAVAEKGHVQLVLTSWQGSSAPGLKVLELTRSKQIGEPKVFRSVIMEEERGRLEKKESGPLYELGIPCISMARRLFKEDPIEVFAMASPRRESKNEDESISCILRFTEQKQASFTVGIGAYGTREFDLIGTKGRIRLENAFGGLKTKRLKFYHDKKITTRRYPPADLISLDLLHFSEGLQKKKKPETKIEDGIEEVKIMEALLLSIDLGTPISLEEINQRLSSKVLSKFPRLGGPRPKLLPLFSSEKTRQ